MCEFEEEEEKWQGRGAAAGCLLRFLALDYSVSAVAPCARLVLRAPGGGCGGGGDFAAAAAARFLPPLRPPSALMVSPGATAAPKLST